jgi:hypothetical protein
MECRNCGNTTKFQAVITDFRAPEIWEIKDGKLERFNQADASDLEIKVTCLKCDSLNIDTQGFKVEAYAEAPLKTLNDEEWDAKINA